MTDELNLLLFGRCELLAYVFLLPLVWVSNDSKEFACDSKKFTYCSNDTSSVIFMDKSHCSNVFKSNLL